MGRRSQERMTRQSFEARASSVAVREKMLAEAEAEEEKRYLEAVAELVRRRKEERARWVNVPDAP